MSQTKVKSGLIDFTEGIDSFIEFSGGNSTVTGNLTVTGTLVGYTPTASLNISNWDTAYSYSQIGHLPITGGTLTGSVSAQAGLTAGNNNTLNVNATTSRVGIGAASPVGKLHVESAGSGYGSVWSIADEVVIEGSGDTGMTIQTPNTAKGTIAFADNNTSGAYIQYNHSTDKFSIATGGSVRLTIGETLDMDGVINSTGGNSTNWNTAYGWGNHASAGYLTSFDITTQTDAKYLRSDESDTMTGSLTVTGGLTVDTNTLFVDSVNDRVGIGTTSPSYPLDLGTSGTGNSIRARRIWASGYGTDSGFSLDNTLIHEDGTGSFVITNPGSYPSAAFYINMAGNVGIGTTSPGNTVHIVGTSDQQLKIDVASGGTFSSINFARANTNIGAIAYNHNANEFQFPYAPNVNTYLSMWAGGSEKIRVAASGNVGVGTASPQAKLHIGNEGSNSYASLRLEGSNRGGQLDMYNGSYPVSQYLTDQSGNIYISTSGGFGNTSLSYKFTISTDGNVGIGTTSPDSLLQIGESYQATSGTNKKILANMGGYYSTVDGKQYQVLGFTGTTFDESDIFTQSGGEASKNFYIGLVSDAGYFNVNRFSVIGGGSEIMSFKPDSKNVGIGTTSPNTKLDVSGSVSVAGGSEGLRIGNIGNNAAYDNVKIYYSGYNSGAPEVVFTPRTTPGGGALTTYFRFKNSNGTSSNNNIAGLTVDGNVGIGTTSPSATLHLQNSQSNAANNTTTGSVFSAVSPNSGVFIRNRGASNGISGSQYTTQLFTDSGSGNFEIYNSSSYYSLVFGTNASERMRITSGGDVGIGKTSVAAKLDIAGAIKNSNRDQTFSRVQKVDGVTGYYSQVKVIFNKTDWGSVTYDIKVASAGGTYHTAGCYYSNPGFSSDLVSISTGSGISLSKTADSPNGGTQGATWTFSGATMIHPIVTVDIACGNGFQATEDSIIITFT